jgi:sporulation protein YtfJ
MGNHPIETLMKTAMESIQQMVDVNTIVGDAVETPDGSVIIPVSKVACGFAAGGSEFASLEGQKDDPGKSDQTQDNEAAGLPFGGGSGAGVSVQPVAFLVVGNGQVRLLPVDSNAVVERIIDIVPDVFDKVSNLFNKKTADKVVITTPDQAAH